MLFYHCQAKCIENQRSAVCINTVTPHRQYPWDKNSPLSPVACQKSLMYRLSVMESVPSSCEVQLGFELILACLVFPSMIYQRSFIQHVGDCYRDHHGHMPWSALQMWSQRTSSVCPGRLEVKTTLPSILFWISVLSFRITRLIYLGLKGAWNYYPGHFVWS